MIRSLLSGVSTVRLDHAGPYADPLQATGVSPKKPLVTGH